MDGLIFLVILIPLIFLLLQLVLLTRSSEQRRLLESLYDKLKELNDDVSDLSKELKRGSEAITPAAAPKEEPPVILPEPVIREATIPEIIFKEETLILEPIFHNEPAPVEKKEKWTPKNSDWEKFIGENLANKIGIAVLVLGIAFFVKYAIDKDWIKEAGRVLIGLASGAILIGLAHYFRNSYRSFSSVLVGGGLSVFYFSIAFAFHQYHLIGQTAAFIIMVIISGLGVGLSLFYNRQELAILATMGGFITPFLVSTGEANHVALFSYLGILNTGLMVLAVFKRWPSINSIALFFTTLIYGGWLIDRTIFDDAVSMPWKDALFFATLFYLLFVVMSVVNTLRIKEKFRAFDFIILLSINFLYYAAGIFIVSEWLPGTNNKAILTAVLGIFNLALAVSFYRNKKVDRNFVTLLIGLSLAFISLIAPVQLKGNHIVLFWTIEMLLLYWLYRVSNIQLLRHASFVIACLMIVGMFRTAVDIYLSGYTILPIIINKGFTTTACVAIALFLYRYIMLNEKPVIRRSVLIAATGIAYLSGLLEIYYQFSTRFTSAPVHILYLLAYTFIVAAILLEISRKYSNYGNLKLLFTTICFGLYLFNIAAVNKLSSELFANDGRIHFIWHWVAVIVLAWLLYDFTKFSFVNKRGDWIVKGSAFAWVMSIIFLLLLSVEMYHLLFWVNFHHETDWTWWKNLYYKAGLTVLWGLCSFAMMWWGMKKHYQPLRIISLTLFSISLVKLFLFDIRNIPPGGKIVAFILLGVLLLAVSFMYQRLKKIIIDNKTD